MNEYETEEQQIEALKRWWKENGTSLVVGLVLGVSGLLGWRYYMVENNAHAVLASDMYMQMMQLAATKNIDDKVIDLNNQLITNFSDTPYAALSSLALAKVEYEKKNYDNAVTQLELAVKHANDDVVKQVASLRLASVYIDQENYSAAASILDQSHDSAYDAQVAELKGDLYLAQGDVMQARAAYDKAIELLGSGSGKWLKLKRQNLGPAGSVDPVQSSGLTDDAATSSEARA